MENKLNIKQFNKKLLIILSLMLAILGALLAVNARATQLVPSEMESLQQSSRPNPTYLTYEDLIDYYDILCCQHGTPLKGASSVILDGSHSGGAFNYSFGELTANDVGKVIESHTIYSKTNDFSSSTYTHFTYGYYSIVEKHIATPKEAYIIAEMKNELNISGSETTYELILDSNGNPIEYTGGLVDAISQQMSTGEMTYTINQQYILQTESGNYIVNQAKDTNGNTYYVYATDSSGNILTYNGELNYVDSKTGLVVNYYGIHTDSVYYEFNGTISSGNTVASSEGTVYLVRYDRVVDINGKLYYCTVSNDYNYIQIAWWSTDMGTSHGTIAPSPSNELAREAEAFEAYILKITNSASVRDLKYAEQEYTIEENGVTKHGSVQAPVIDYKPDWVEDIDGDGKITEEADEATVSFDYANQQYIIGPFAVDYVKEAVAISGRNPVEFSTISNAKLIATINGENVELELGKDWKFLFIADQGRQPNDPYIYPNPNEEFYVVVNYKVGLTALAEFGFEFKYMNAGAELDIYDGNYNTVTWTVKYEDHYEDVEVTSGNTTTTVSVFKSRDIWLELTSMEPHDSQTLAHALKGARWYNTTSIKKDFGIPSTPVVINKTTVDENGEKVLVNKTYNFTIYVNGKEFETIAVKVKDGKGTATSAPIYWTENGKEDGTVTFMPPTVEVVENGNEDNNGPWSGTANGSEFTINAINYIKPKHTNIEVDKKLINSTPALEGEIFDFLIKITGKFRYGANGEYKTYTSNNPYTINVRISSSNNWKWVSDEIYWYGSSQPHYTVEEIIPDNADYELVDGAINNGTGYLTDGIPSIAIATNQPNSTGAYIEIDKRLVSSTLPEVGEVFYAELVIEGTFNYGNEKISGSKTINIRLDENNNWIWKSEYITWKAKDTAPKYNVKEVNIPEGIDFVSISNEIKTVTENGLTGTISKGANKIIISNTVKTKNGSLKIIKELTDEILEGEVYTAHVIVEGKFKYNNIEYTKLELDVTLDQSNNFVWESGNFSWKETDGTPTYSVEEINIPANVKFVSISNGKTTVTSSQKITGELNGANGTGSVQTIITCINAPDTLYKGGHLVIVKESEKTELNNKKFFFKVTLTGTFKYNGVQYNNTTLTLNGESDGVIAICGGEDWISGYIEWDAKSKGPKYTVEEIGSESGVEYEFVSISNTEKTTDLNRISGEVKEGIKYNYIIAINTTTEELHGSLELSKVAKNDVIKGDSFYFDITITGKFTYNGIVYTTENPLKLENIEVIADGDAWKSDVFYWNSKDDAPTYTVVERTDKFEDGVELVDLRNATQTSKTNTISGTISEGDSATWVIAENIGTKIYQGKIKIDKTLYYKDANGASQELTDNKFVFKVIVTRNYKDGTTKTEETYVTVKAGSSWTSGWYYWTSDENTPTYEVEEYNIPNGCTVTYKNGSNKGELEALDEDSNADGIVKVTAVNNLDTQKSKLKINKELILNDKLNINDVNVTFTFDVVVSGKFIYKGTYYDADEGKNLTLRVTIAKTNNWTWTMSDYIYWFGDAPEYAVSEPSSYIPTSWKLVSMDNSSGKLESNKTTVVECTNEWYYEEEIKLVMNFGGKVWDDTNRNLGKDEDRKENGKIDEGEAGISNIKVILYRALAEKSSGKIVKRLTSYDGAKEVAITYTDSLGNWSVENISVPAFIDEAEKEQYSNYIVTYDVEFIYDGQTYEPTTFLENSNGSWETYVNATTSNKDAYLYDSMAVDYTLDSVSRMGLTGIETRKEYNASFTTITGESAINDNGETLGLAVGANGQTKDLHYTSIDSVSVLNSDNTRKISTLETENSDGEIYEELAIVADTASKNLAFPFYNENAGSSIIGKADVSGWHLTSWDSSITDHLTITYYFEATYNYCLSINLGLIEREAADLGVEKDLTEAMVVVNGKALKYKFNKAIDMDNLSNEELVDILYKQIEVADANIEYTLGIYKSDYYYRAAVYGGTDAGNALDTFYRSLSLPIESTELEIYLKYTINVYNESETYDVVVGSIADYSDSTVELIASDEVRYIQTLNGKSVENTEIVASPATVIYSNGATQSVSWNVVESLSDNNGKEYKKMTTESLSGTKLSSGEKASITTTFKVSKLASNEDGVLNALIRGKKNNIAEIVKFTSYYSESSKNKWSTPGEVTGRVDEDSAPNNISLAHNDKSWYEDDTDAAPTIVIDFYDDDREVSGIAWDDAQTSKVEYGQVVGNGVYNPDEGDRIISGLTTEIYEIISIPSKDNNGNTVYTEYKFAWPTDKPIAELGNKTIKDITGFSYYTTTNNGGGYAFVGIPAGNYKVRFVYGDKVISTGKTGSEEVYSGQDYKSTAYQAGFDNDSDNNGYVDNEWHDLTNTTLASARVSDALDNEARRLYITAKSEMLTYNNTSVLAIADDKSIAESQEASELFGNYADVSTTAPITGEGYYMFAETAKINLGIENVYEIGYTTETLSTVELGTVNGDSKVSGIKTGTKDFKYIISDIDCGIEERSQTKLTLDKQIKEITLTTSDNRVILDVIYNISYTLGTDGSIKSLIEIDEAASTGFDNVASLNRNGATTQGYRYLMVDSQILQGTVLKIKYQLTVFNMSETDRANKDLVELWEQYTAVETEAESNAILANAIEKISSEVYTTVGDKIYKVYNNNGNYEKIEYGMYFGSIYYLGKAGVSLVDEVEEPIVKTKVHSMIDYVDPDIEFTDLNNKAKNQSWANIEIDYLLENNLIDPSIVKIMDENGKLVVENGKYVSRADREKTNSERYTIMSDTYQEYAIDTKNNIIANIESDIDDEGGNPSLIRFLEPFMANKSVDNSVATIDLEVSRFYSSESDSNDIDNIAEIIKAENNVGRRDIRAIAGNANPFELEEESSDSDPIGVYKVAVKEPDSSATEVITLSPPTGDEGQNVIMQLLLVILISVIIVAVGIVIIKKKVLIQQK